MTRLPNGRVAAALVAVVLSSSCGGDGKCKAGSTEPSCNPQPTLRIESTGPQLSAPVGGTVEARVLVREETIRTGPTPKANVSVTFAVASGGGSVPVGPVTTNAEGIARISWTLGTDAASAQTLTAGVSSSVSTNVSANATALGVVLLVQPSDQAQCGIALPRQPSLKVQSVGQDVQRAGIVVGGRLTGASGGLIGTLTATTGSNGIATFTDLGFACPGDCAL